MMEFCTRTKSRVLEDLVEKVRSLPPNHPDRTHLMRMITDLGLEIERSGPAGRGWLDDAHGGQAVTGYGARLMRIRVRISPAMVAVSPSVASPSDTSSSHAWARSH